MLRCPSAPCEPGSEIIGRVDSGGKVIFVNKPFVVTDEFVVEARKHKKAEKRYRFSSACKGAQCSQWADGACSLPRRLDELIPRSSEDKIPECGIRGSCRWFAQAGSAACQVCIFVTTERDVEDE